MLWICRECGYMHTTKEAWNICPLCGASQGEVELHLPFKKENLWRTRRVAAAVSRTRRTTRTKTKRRTPRTAQRSLRTRRTAAEQWREKKERILLLPTIISAFLPVGFFNRFSSMKSQSLDDNLFLASQRYFKESGFEIQKLTYDLHKETDTNNIETEHEKMFTNQGIKIKALIAIKK